MYIEIIVYINTLKNNLCLHIFFSSYALVYSMLLGNVLGTYCCPAFPSKEDILLRGMCNMHKFLISIK